MVKAVAILYCWKRNYKNVRRLFQDTLVKSERNTEPLITTDGFKPYARVIKRLFGCSCVYGQVIKIRRKDKVHRLTPSHARRPQYLKDHLELFQCHYNFIRPHSALKYGNEIWTPAVQAGLTSRRLTFRQVFLAAIASSIFVFILCLRKRQNVKIQPLVICLSNS
jgi:transposase InsO family protein